MVDQIEASLKHIVDILYRRTIPFGFKTSRLNPAHAQIGERDNAISGLGLSWSWTPTGRTLSTYSWRSRLPTNPLRNRSLSISNRNRIIARRGMTERLSFYGAGQGGWWQVAKEMRSALATSHQMCA